MKLFQTETLGPGALLLLLATTAVGALEPLDWRGALIPKREVGQPAFLEKHPEWDGRDVVIAIFDTGVDPAAAGLAVTTTGQRKVLDILDASGSGDVDTSKVVKEWEREGELKGLSGRTLTLPSDLAMPEDGFRLGIKAARELFEESVHDRLVQYESTRWRAEVTRREAERRRQRSGEDRSFEKKAKADQTLEEQDRAARERALEGLEKNFLKAHPGIHYDCLVWKEAGDWQVLVDTDRDGDLTDEKQLRPYGVAGEYAVFDAVTNASFGVQVYEEGALLSIVVVSDTHGTHVASIAAAHDPEDRARDGIAPGAQIVSIRIGDPRTGGGSFGPSERRALGLAAQYGVDIVNASWGGASVYQDGKDANSGVYDRLVEGYDIFAVLSAGNNGPALGTARSAGGEASRVLGVGAYVSEEMGRILYSTLPGSPETSTTLQFTSRGPTKDGDLGVDVMAPGAALASYSAESLQGFEMANGTSMSAPSAAGVAALIVSAAKAEGLDYSPARLRAAMMQGARPIDAGDSLSEGTGLVSVSGSWDRLVALQGVEAFRAFYDLAVSEGSFAEEGRGFYLRGAPKRPQQRVVVRVQPAWTESVTAEERFAFEAGLQLVAADEWIEVPMHFHLSNGENAFIMHLTYPATEGEELGSVWVSRVDALLADRPELGPVFSVPVTIVRPAASEVFKDNRAAHVLSTAPGTVERMFFDAPEGAERLRVRMRHEAEDSIARRFVLHGLTVAAESSFGAYEEIHFPRLEVGEEETFDFPVLGGHVTELVINQRWSGVGRAKLELEMEWIGLGLPATPVVIEPNLGWAVLPFRPLADGRVEAEAKIDEAMHTLMPVATETLPFDERANLPGTRWTPGEVRQQRLRQRFEWELEEPLTATIQWPQPYDHSEEIGGGLVSVYHDSGEFLGYRSGGSRGGLIELPAGKVIFYREFNAFRPDLLAAATEWPLRLATKASGLLPVYGSLRERFRGRATATLDLVGGRETILLLEDAALKDLSRTKPTPDYYTGEIAFSDASERGLGSVDILYLAGTPFDKTANQEPEASKGKDPKGAVAKLADDLFARRLEFIRAERGTDDQATAERRAELLTTLIEERSGDPAPVLEKAIDVALEAGLAGEVWGEGSTEAPVAGQRERVVELLEEAVRRCEPDAVSRFFGARPTVAPGDADERRALAEREAQMKETRTQLARIAVLRADVDRALGDYGAARASLREAMRWEDKPGKEHRAVAMDLDRAQGYLGLALEAVEARLADKPHDRKLLKERLELYEELGWAEFAEIERQRLELWARGRAILEEG